jgi:hypothetical protein
MFSHLRFVSLGVLTPPASDGQRKVETKEGKDDHEMPLAKYVVMTGSKCRIGIGKRTVLADPTCD